MPVINVAADLADFINDPLRQIVAHLAKNDQADALGMLDQTNLVECNYEGYAPQPVLNIVMDDASTDEVAHATADAVEWISGNVTVPQTPAFVYFTEIYNGGAPQFLKWVPLDKIMTIDRPGIKITQVMELWASDLES